MKNKYIPHVVSIIASVLLTICSIRLTQARHELLNWKTCYKYAALAYMQTQLKDLTHAEVLEIKNVLDVAQPFYVSLENDQGYLNFGFGKGEDGVWEIYDAPKDKK